MSAVSSTHAPSAGPSSQMRSQTRSSRQQQQTQDQQQQQQQQQRAKRRWVQLIDSWVALHSPRSANAIVEPTSVKDARQELVDQIARHSQLICKSVHDRDWLLSAFQMAVTAVLIPSETGAQLPRDSDQLSLVMQLGQQLVQLAIHSVATPLVQLLQQKQQQNVDAEMLKTVQEALIHFQQLSDRLITFDNLRNLTEMLDLPTLPLDCVLEQDTASLLLALASLSQASELLPPLLQRQQSLIEASHSVRFPILAQLIHSTGSDLEKLAAAGLLIGWEDGKEAGSWSQVSSDSVLELQTLATFYREQIESLHDIGLTAEANVLASLAVSALKGQDTDAARAKIQSAADALRASASSDSVESKDSPSAGLEAIRQLAETVPASSITSGTSKQMRLQAAQKTISQTRGPLASQLAHLIDVSDGAATRSHVAAVIEQALDQSSTTDMQEHELAALLVALVFARPAVGGFRIDMATAKNLLQDLDSAAKTVASTLRIESSAPHDLSSGLAPLFRSALDSRLDGPVPACQLFSLLSNGKAAPRQLVADTQQCLSWLVSTISLLEAQTDRPDFSDICWLAAYGGSSGSPKEQDLALCKLVECFSAMMRASSTSSGASSANERGGGLDVASLRIKAAWTNFFEKTLALLDPNGPLAAVPPRNGVEKLLVEILSIGEVDLFRNLASDGSVTEVLKTEELEDLVLRVSTTLFDKASSASTRNKNIKLALDVLSASPGPGSVRIKLQSEFIHAACRLSSFKIRSRVNPGQPVEPKEIRTTKDKLDLVARLLASQEDAYRSPELVLEIATRLSAVGDGLVDDPKSQPLTRSATETDVESPASEVQSEERKYGLSPSEKMLIEIRTLAMLADAATASEDFEVAASFCHRLVGKVDILRTRTSASSSTPDTSKASAGTAATILPQALELGWRSCFQLSKHPVWSDTPSKVTMLAHALALCPADQLSPLLRQWQKLDRQLVAEVAAGKTFTSTKKAAAAGGWLSLGSAASGAGSGAGEGGRRAGDLANEAANAAAAAASVGAGLVGFGANAAANLLPLSFSPLSYFSSAAGGGGVASSGGSLSSTGGGSVGDSGRGQGGIDSRTARLFDFGGNTQDQTEPPAAFGGAYASTAANDPAERAIRAARAARDFLGWKSSQSDSDAQQGHSDPNTSSGGGNGGGGGGGGFSLSRGVGWLIGDDKH
ncbi:hypothetical protein BCV70DRAFT_199961 [Testicularia cyperi]|uniref:Sec39 domain-containing protein n=1 Tax=Testicularia cyperi TaxID=1882483 RepID=A0A317XSE1_9BASI|nr:hypothetical protein BCV70DRAFT_199961 [Testicularia cyperi]